MGLKSDQYPLPLPREQKMSAEDFMVTESNREALMWIEQWPDWPSHCLVLYGPTGSGKTHLAEIWRQRSSAEIMSSFNIRPDISAPTNIIIDNADVAADNDLAEENLFHLFNNLRELGGFMLLTANNAPTEWGIMLPDLRSRLVASTAVALLAPDDQLLSAMLIKQFRDRQLQVEAGVIDYILPRIERSADAVRNIVNSLDNASLASGKGITISLVRKIM